MLTQPTFLFGTAGGPGTYTTDIHFSDAAKAQYLAPGDVLTDRLGALYAVSSWVGFPSDFASNGTATVTPVGADVAPTDGLALGDSSIETPGQVDVAPQVQTGGSLGSAVLIEGRTYKYQCTAGFSISSEANKALVGDRFLDNAGKPFEITALSGQPGAFVLPFEAVEVDKIGDGPNIGDVFLYRGTPNLGFYQGTALNPLAEDEVRNRDEFLTDLNIPHPSGSGGTDGGSISPDEVLVIAGSGGTVTQSHSLVLCTDPGPVSVALSGPFTDGKIIYVKDGFNGFSNRLANPITIIPPAGDTIGFNPSVLIQNAGQSYTLILSSNVWHLV